MRRAVNARSTFPASSSAASTRTERERRAGSSSAMEWAPSGRALRHVTARADQPLLNGDPQAVAAEQQDVHRPAIVSNGPRLTAGQSCAGGRERESTRRRRESEVTTGEEGDDRAGDPSEVQAAMADSASAMTIFSHGRPSSRLRTRMKPALGARFGRRGGPPAPGAEGKRDYTTGGASLAGRT